ncbi:MAG: glycosyltransferase family 2 protein [Christensenellales bacterium]
MDHPLLSVIIPVYNAQEFLSIALDSVFSQDIKDMEIILVNDGSKDDSLSLCRQYAAKDERIVVIDQQNAGPGAARNAALKVAKGRYLSFVDSDDSLQPGAYRSMLSAIQKNEACMVIAHFNILMKNQIFDRGYIKQDTYLDREAFFHALAYRPGSYYYSALWNKLYKRQIIQENHLSFNPTLSWGEDFEFNMAYYRHIQKVCFVSEPVYNYRRTYSGQTWRTMFELHSSFRIKSELYKRLKSLYQHAGLFEKYRLYIYRYIFNITIST